MTIGLNDTGYRFRTVDCPDCDGTRMCEECGGIGHVDAACAECLRGEPLNDDGLCEQCTDACTLPIADYNEKWVPLTTCVGDPLLHKQSRKAA